MVNKWVIIPHKAITEQLKGSGCSQIWLQRSRAMTEQSGLVWIGWPRPSGYSRLFGEPKSVESDGGQRNESTRCSERLECQLRVKWQRRIRFHVPLGQRTYMRLLKQGTSFHTHAKEVSIHRLVFTLNWSKHNDLQQLIKKRLHICLTLNLVAI